MRCFFATTSLNFNNIFSSGSISPYKFYKNKKFGNSRFFKIANDKIDDGIILYKKIPQVILDSTLNMEQYPLIIELDLEYKNLSGYIYKIDENIFIIKKTIYLHNNLKSIYCKKEEHIIQLIKKSEYNLETKDALFYLDKFKILNDMNIHPILIDDKSLKVDDNNYRINNEIKNDIFFDTIKSLYYSLAILTPELCFTRKQLEFNSFIKYIKKYEYNNSIFKEKGISEINEFKEGLFKKKEDIYAIYKLPFIILPRNRKILLNKEEFMALLDNDAWSEYEFEFLNVILNEIIYSKISLSHMSKSIMIETILRNIGEEANTMCNGMFRKDLILIYKGLVNKTVNINIDEFEYEISKCLYVTLLKINNYEEFKKMIEQKNLKYKKIPQLIYYSIIGYSSLALFRIEALYNSEYDKDIVENGLLHYNKDITRKYHYKKQFKKEIYEYLCMLKTQDKYYKFLSKKKQIEINMGIEIKTKNNGSSRKILIFSDSLYQITIYQKDNVIYKGIQGKFRKTLEKLFINPNRANARFYAVEYRIYSESMNNKNNYDISGFRSLAIHEEEQFLELIKLIYNLL